MTKKENILSLFGFEIVTWAIYVSIWFAIIHSAKNFTDSNRWKMFDPFIPKVFSYFENANYAAFIQNLLKICFWLKIIMHGA
jgi:hypothetical protein